MQMEEFEKPKTPKDYRCEKCDKTFTSSAGLRQHRPSHNDEPYFQCKKCDKRFSYSPNLSEHKSSCHSEDLHMCPICNKPFATANYLKKHLRLCQKREERRERDKNDPNKRIRKRNRNKTTNDLIVTSGSVPESIEQLGDVVKRIEDLKTFDEKDEERENPQTISIDLPDPPELESFSTEYAVNAAILPSLDEFNPETNGFQSIFNDLERSAYGPTSSQFDNYGSFDSNGSFGNQQGFQYERNSPTGTSNNFYGRYSLDEEFISTFSGDWSYNNYRSSSVDQFSFQTTNHYMPGFSGNFDLQYPPQQTTQSYF